MSSDREILEPAVAVIAKQASKADALVEEAVDAGSTAPIHSRWPRRQ